MTTSKGFVPPQMGLGLLLIIVGMTLAVTVMFQTLPLLITSTLNLSQLEMPLADLFGSNSVAMLFIGFMVFTGVVLMIFGRDIRKASR